MAAASGSTALRVCMLRSTESGDPLLGLSKCGTDTLAIGPTFHVVAIEHGAQFESGLETRVGFNATLLEFFGREVFDLAATLDADAHSLADGFMRAPERDP